MSDVVDDNVSEKNIIHLVRFHPVVSPLKYFSELSSNCGELRVDKMDVYGDFALGSNSSWLRKFEEEVQTMCRKEDAMFLPSGVMAQGIVLKVAHSMQLRSGDKSDDQTSSSFIVHHSSHLLIHERNASAELLNMNAVVIPPIPNIEIQQPLRYVDIEPLLGAKHPPFALFIEIPSREIGGKLTPWEDLLLISSRARATGVHLHMDGARLWEAAAGYGRPVSEICSLFDSVYVSFYKGLGALNGAMLLGTSRFLSESRVWLRRFGGNLHSQLPLALDSWGCFRRNKDKFDAHTARMQAVGELITNTAAEVSSNSSSGSSPPLLRLDPVVPEVCMIHVWLGCSASTARAARDKTQGATGVRVFERIRGKSKDGTSCYFEMNMGAVNGAIGDEVWVGAYTDMLTEIKSTRCGPAILPPAVPSSST